jgi:hypothetical protein
MISWRGKQHRGKKTSGGRWIVTLFAKTRANASSTGRLIVNVGDFSLAHCLAELGIQGNRSEQFRLNLLKHADTTSVRHTRDFELYAKRLITDLRSDDSSSASLERLSHAADFAAISARQGRQQVAILYMF